MPKRILFSAAVLLLASCNQSADTEAPNSAMKVGTAKPKRSAYCFFKDEETKGWKASLDRSGNVTVTGKAHIKDARYKAELGRAEVSGKRAELSPTIAPNTGYASPDNWWDVRFAIPNSTAVTDVTVSCGRKTLAELAVERRS